MGPIFWGEIVKLQIDYKSFIVLIWTSPVQLIDLKNIDIDMEILNISISISIRGVWKISILIAKKGIWNISISISIKKESIFYEIG